MRTIRWRIALALAIATVCVCAAIANSALAQTVSAYPPDNEARTFSTGAGGWTGSSSSAGFCDSISFCPAVTNSFQPSGGTGGASDGYLRSVVGPNIAGVNGEVSAIWQSPSFTYQGAGGQTPDLLQFAIHRRADIAAFLSATSTAADYTVEIVNAGSGATVAVPIDHQPISDSDEWVPISVPVDP